MNLTNFRVPSPDPVRGPVSVRGGSASSDQTASLLSRHRAAAATAAPGRAAGGGGGRRATGRGGVPERHPRLRTGRGASSPETNEVISQPAGQIDRRDTAPEAATRGRWTVGTEGGGQWGQREVDSGDRGRWTVGTEGGGQWVQREVDSGDRGRWTVGTEGGGQVLPPDVTG